MQALLLLRRPPCWNSTARLARHARLDSLDKVERVESCSNHNYRFYLMKLFVLLRLQLLSSLLSTNSIASNSFPDLRIYFSPETTKLKTTDRILRLNLDKSGTEQ